MLSDLAFTPFAETLRRLSAAHSTGDLQVQSGRASKTVSFDKGRLVFAASNLKQDRLGESLLASGRINEDQFRLASDLMSSPHRKRRFGDILVDAGIMHRDEVGQAVARQVRRIVLSLFRLSEGVANFDERPCSVPLELMVNVSVHQALYLGIRTMTDERLVRAGLGDLERKVVAAKVPPFRFPVEKCPEEEREIIERCASRRRIADLLGEEPSLWRLQAVYALLASGVLREAEGAADLSSPPVVQGTTPRFLLASTGEAPSSPHAALRRELHEQLARTGEEEEHEWQKVLKAASPGELVEALEAKLERYAALLEAFDGEEDLRRDLERVVGRAYSLVRRARRRVARAQAHAHPEARPAAPKAPAPAVTKAPVAAKAPAAAKAPVAAKAPAPAAPAAAPAVPTGPAAPAPAAATSLPFGVPPVAVAPPALRTSPPAAPGPPAVAPAPEEPPAPAPEPRPTVPPEVAHAARIDELLTWGNIRMTISDYAHAVEAYAEVVDLAPRVAGHRLRLAVAMSRWPQTARRAEREYLEALRLAPNDAEAHYLLGVYYREMKLRNRAIEQLRTAVALDPQNKRAREALEALSPKDSALQSLRKMLG